MTPNGGGPDLLLVCRANRGRSPVAARVLTAYAAEQRLRRCPRIRTSGLYAEPGRPLLPDAERVLLARDLRVPDHSSRAFDLEEARAARLVLTFERTLLQGIVEQDPALLTRTFTLREVLRLVHSPRWDPAGNGDAEVAALLHRLRPRVAAGEDETPDPGAYPGRNARRILTEVVDESRAVAPYLLGPAQASGAA